MSATALIIAISAAGLSLCLWRIARAIERLATMIGIVVDDPADDDDTRWE